MDIGCQVYKMDFDEYSGDFFQNAKIHEMVDLVYSE